MDIKQQVRFLKRIDFFENFDEHELRQFLAVTKWLKVPAGKPIIKENSVERVFYILVKGRVSVVKTVDGGRTVELTTLDSGACFGEISLVMDVKRTAGVITRTECFILKVEPRIISTSNVFLQLKFYKRFGEILAARLIQANERLASMDQPDFSGLKDVEAADQPLAEDDLRDAEQEMDEARRVRDLPPPPPGPLPPLPEKKDRIVKRSLQRRITAALDLPINPVIAERLAPHLRGECVNTRLFADLVHLDPVLSSKVLQVANSSYFRRSTPVATVAHAMITVGMKQVQQALSEAIDTAGERVAFSGYHVLAASYWRHAVVVARIAVMLKDLIRLDLPTDVYLAGLLHDVGYLALDAVEPDFYPHLTDPDAPLHADLLGAEKDHIGVDHGTAGSWFGESIGLPGAFLDVMRHHHAPEKARDHALPTAIVHLADLFARKHGAQTGAPGDGEVAIIESFAWVVVQDHHRPFLDVNVADFIDSVDREIDNTWSSLTEGLDF